MRWRWRRVAALVVLAGAAGCGPITEGSDDAGSIAGDLVDVSLWEVSGPEHDPFFDHRPAEVLCPSVAWGAEGASLEVRTGDCRYLSLEQPLLHGVSKGSTLLVSMWHQVLHADFPATGHVALAVDHRVVWEREVPIPGPDAIWRDEVVLDADLLAGSRVVFHLHNHGANTWNLGEVSAR